MWLYIRNNETDADTQTLYKIKRSDNNRIGQQSVAHRAYTVVRATSQSYGDKDKTDLGLSDHNQFS